MGKPIAVNATQPDQIEAFEKAREAISAAVMDDQIEARTWDGDVTDGEVLRILAEAYVADPPDFHDIHEFREARKRVKTDLIQSPRHTGEEARNPTDEEVVRILSQAYIGTIRNTFSSRR